MARPLAYGNPLLTRDIFIAEAEAHRRADHYMSGTYVENERDGSFRGGCAVGCAIDTVMRRTGVELHHTDRKAFSRSLGWPIQVVNLQEAIFETLPQDERIEWPVRIARAVPDHADLSGVWPAFAAWMLRDVLAPALSSDERSMVPLVEKAADARESGSKIRLLVAKMRLRLAGKSGTEAMRGVQCMMGNPAWYQTAFTMVAISGKDETFEGQRQHVFFMYTGDSNAVARRMADKLCELLATAPVPAAYAQTVTTPAVMTVSPTRIDWDAVLGDSLADVASRPLRATGSESATSRTPELLDA